MRAGSCRVRALNANIVIKIVSRSKRADICADRAQTNLFISESRTWCCGKREVTINIVQVASSIRDLFITFTFSDPDAGTPTEGASPRGATSTCGLQRYILVASFTTLSFSADPIHSVRKFSEVFLKVVPGKEKPTLETAEHRNFTDLTVASFAKTTLHTSGG